MRHKSRFLPFSIKPLFRMGTTTLVFLALASCTSAPRRGAVAQPNEKLHFPGEKHLKNIRQLTYGGTNAEAYWSFDGEWLTFQAKGGGIPGLTESKPECDQIYRIRQDGTDGEMVSSGKGRTTCSFYVADPELILFSSTEGSDAACPAEPDRSKGYVWPIYPTYQIYTVNPEKKDAPAALEPGAPRAYNAEAVTCKDGSVVFTSDRDGDLELYVGKLDRFGTMGKVKRITHTPGYDGGAFFSQDCKKLVWRASRPTGKDLEDYQGLLKQHLVRPGKLEIFVANADGSEARQVTRLGAASFAPYFTPDAKRVLFSSNFADPQGRSFAIYSIRVDGTGLEQITHSGVFDGFPMFSPDGKKLAFSSNRNGTRPRETNVFIADWVDQPEVEVSLDSTIPTERYLGTIKALASDDFKGRGIGTKEMEQVEDFTATLFQRAGMKPFFETFPKSTITPTSTTAGTSSAGSTYKHAIQIKPLEFHKAAAPTVIDGHNILGTLGEGCGKKSPAVLIGAHVDHLGMGTSRSLEPSKKGIHHGADDNASGVAAILESARILKSRMAAEPKKWTKACFIFSAFTGEESGIAGSARTAELIQSMNIPLKAMLNLDMVGRLRNNQLIVFGTDSAKEWKSMVEEECLAMGLTCPGGGDGYGPSDHMPFYMKGAPVLHFFTGPHADYHRPSDTWEKINATGGVQVAETVSRVAARVALSPKGLTYHKPGKNALMLTRADGSTVTPGDQARSGMGKAFLGTIPDYAQMTSPTGPGGDQSKRGVLLTGARSGSPAETAGIQPGDILFSISKEEGQTKSEFSSLAEYMGVLRTLNPGDKIVLGIRRGEEILSLPATVGSRQAE